MADATKSKDPNALENVTPVDANTPGNKGVSTKKMDLNRDFNINGVQYTAGKDVEVNSDHVQAIKNLDGDAETAASYASTHHGAVPMHTDPTEATAQTPTRPLGAEHIRVDAAIEVKPTELNPVIIEDTKPVVPKDADKVVVSQDGENKA